MVPSPHGIPRPTPRAAGILALADDYGIPVDVPFRDLTADQRNLHSGGVKARNFGGLKGFFEWLERRKYKMHLRVFLSRWRSYHTCAVCHGSRCVRKPWLWNWGG